MDEPLLLHSLLEHRDLVFGCLDAVEPRRVVEIGSESGGLTKALVDWAAGRGATVVTVEPRPTPEIRRLAGANDRFELVEDRSPAALERIDPADAYVIDGDHNYWTVSRELELVFSTGSPLAILHDVGWPWGRRDLYYDPTALPPQALRPHAYNKGTVPDSDELVDGGFRGAGQFAVAIDHGGPRNGVRTAVEDFVGARPGIGFREIAPVFGVGFVYAKDAPYAGRLTRRLAPWHESSLLEHLERNRVGLYAKLLSLQDEVGAQRLRYNRALLDYEDRFASAQAEVAALRLERARLRAQLQAANGAASTRGGAPSPR